MPMGLLRDAVTGVHENQRKIRGRRTSDHIPGVLGVTRCICDDELPHRGREIPVGDIDRDPLLPFSAKPIGEQGEVEFLPTPLT